MTINDHIDQLINGNVMADTLSYETDQKVPDASKLGPLLCRSV